MRRVTVRRMTDEVATFTTTVRLQDGERISTSSVTALA